MRRISYFLLVAFLLGNNYLVVGANELGSYSKSSTGGVSSGVSKSGNLGDFSKSSTGGIGGSGESKGGSLGASSKSGSAGFSSRPIFIGNRSGCPLRPVQLCRSPYVNVKEYKNGCWQYSCALPKSKSKFNAPWFFRAQNYESLLGSYYYVFTSEGLTPVTSYDFPNYTPPPTPTPTPITSINTYYEPTLSSAYKSSATTMALFYANNNPNQGVSPEVIAHELNISRAIDEATDKSLGRFANNPLLRSIAVELDTTFASIAPGLSLYDKARMAEILGNLEKDPNNIFKALELAKSLSPKQQKPIELPKDNEVAKQLVEAPKLNIITEDKTPTVIPETAKRGNVIERLFPSPSSIVRSGIRFANYVLDIFRLKQRFSPMPVSTSNNSMYLAQSLNRDKQLSTKSYYQDQYWKKVNEVAVYVSKAIPTALSYSGINNGSFTSAGSINYFNEASNIESNLVSCLTATLQGKINSPTLDDELEIYGYLLWFFDETIDAVTRIYNSDLSNNEKIEKMVTIVNGCKKLSKSTFASVKDYKDKILEAMNKDILVSAPSKVTKATIDSVEITVYGDFAKVGFENKGKSNNCNTFINDDSIGTIEWTSSDKAGVSDNIKTFASTAPNKETKYLKVTNCRFQVPSNAKTVDGIKVKIERATEGGSEVVKDLSIKLVRDGKVVGANNASTTAWTDKDVIGIYGSETDTWGVAWEPRDFNNTQFGIVIAAKNEGVAPAKTAEVAKTETTAQAVTPAPKAAPVETPMNKLIKYLTTGSLKLGDKGDNVATLQTEILVKVKMGPQAESLASSISKGTVKPGTYGATTADAVFFMKNVLGAWAANNKKTDDADFAQIIKDVKSKNKEFNNATWNGFLKYVKANS